MPRQNRYLVTGGAGFIGSSLALEIQNRNLGDVVVVDNFSCASLENLKGFKGDIVTSDMETGDWTRRVVHVDVIFHLAAITDTTVMDVRRMMEVNVEGFRKVLDFAVKTGVVRVVYASSAGVYGKGACPMKEDQELSPQNPYAYSKMVLENIAMEFARRNPAFTVVGLRYFNVYGPNEAHKVKAASMICQLAQQMKQGRRPRIFKHGEQARDFIYVKDVVKANLKALSAGVSGVVNVCTGKAVTFNRVIEVLNLVLGTELEPEYFNNPYSFYQENTRGDPSLAEESIGFQSSCTVEEGIADYIKRSERCRL